MAFWWAFTLSVLTQLLDQFVRCWLVVLHLLWQTRVLNWVNYFWFGKSAKENLWSFLFTRLSTFILCKLAVLPKHKKIQCLAIGWFYVNIIIVLPLLIDPYQLINHLIDCEGHAEFLCSWKIRSISCSFLGLEIPVFVKLWRYYFCFLQIIRINENAGCWLAFLPVYKWKTYRPVVQFLSLQTQAVLSIVIPV